METPFKISEEQTLILHSDPTYEAWKQANLALNFALTVNSDPTYEAWKLTSAPKPKKLF